MKNVKSVKIILFLLVFLMPFAQGLYFYMELFGFMLLVVGLLGLVLVHKKELVIHRSRGLFLLGFVVLSMATIFYGIDSFMAVIGTLKFISYFLIYLLLQQLYDQTFKEQLIQVVVYSGIVMALLSLLLMNTDLFSRYLVQNGRLGGFFQYANTFGIFLLVCFLLLLIEPFRIDLKLLGGLLLMVAMMMTFSRGVLLLAFLSVLLLFFLKVFKERRSLIKKEQEVDEHLKTGYKHLLIIPITLVLGVIMGLMTWRIMGQQALVNRIGEHFNSSEFLSRILYYKDGLTMLREYPLGLGHLGYHYIQEAFQTGAAYHVKFIHNNLLQMSLDLGIIGGLLFLGFFVSMIIQRQLKWEYRLITAVIFIHGMIDFDFQFGFIWVVVLILTTITSDKQEGSKWVLPSFKASATGFRSLCAVTGLIYLFFFFVTFLQYTNHYEIALTIAPWYTEARIDYFRSLPREDVLKQEVAEGLIKYQDFFVDSFAYMRDYDYNNKEYEEALEFSQMCIRRNPMEITHVESYSKILTDLAYHNYQLGDFDESLRLIDTIREIPDYLTSMEETRKTEFDVKHRVHFQMTKLLVENQLNAEGLRNQIIQRTAQE